MPRQEFKSKDRERLENVTMRCLATPVALLMLVCFCPAAEPATVVPVDGQPLAANVTRLTQALDFLGAPLPEALRLSLADAVRKVDAQAIQQLLDKHVLFIVE